MIVGIERGYLVMVGELRVKLILDAFKSATYDKVSDTLKLPYNFENLQWLYYMGFDVSGWEYGMHFYTPPLVEGKYPFMPHQIEGLSKMTTWAHCFNLSEPRTMKTATCIGGIDLLKKLGKVGSVLVITPLSTIYSVWEKEIKGMGDWSVGILHDPSKPLKKKAEYFQELINDDLDYYIINPAGIRSPHVLKVLLEARKKGHFNAIIVDESTDFANQSSRGWKALNKIKADADYLWLLTGTVGGAEKVHGQARLINPDMLPSDKHIWKMRTMVEVQEHVWVHKPCAVDMIREVLTPALRYKREDILDDVPEELTFMRHVPLDNKSSTLYNTLIDELVVELQLGEDKELIRPKNAGVMVSKLCQISSGTLITKSKVLKFNIDLKIEDVQRLIKESEGKTIIVGHFVESLKYISDILSDKGYNVALVTGSVSAKERGRIFTDFMHNDEGIQVLVSQHQPIKFGVELASASTIIFFGVPLMSAGDYKQVKDRIYSGKQKASRPAVYLLYSEALEYKMFERLENGVEWETNLTDYFVSTK